MQYVDFLPSDYHRQAADHRLRVWLAALLALWAAVLGGVAAYQHLAAPSLGEQFRQMQAPYRQVQAAKRRLAELRAQLAEANQMAELYTYLRHPWPRTQILAALIENLPPEIRLSEVTICREQAEEPAEAGARQRPQRNPTGSAQPEKATARQILQQLRREIDRSRTIVYARGVTTDNSALHRCIAALTRCRLFTKADLVSLDSLDEQGAGQAFTFEISLEVLPGYGQPGGPETPPAAEVARLP